MPNGRSVGTPANWGSQLRPVHIGSVWRGMHNVRRKKMAPADFSVGACSYPFTHTT
jgi:hypothetical protein